MRIKLYLLGGSIALMLLSVVYISHITPIQVEAYQYVNLDTKHAREPILSLKQHVWNLLTEEGGLSFDEAIEGMAIVNLESRWDTYAIGVNKDGSKDLGLWQISEKYHDIGRECSFDAYCSTRYAIKLYREWGNWTAWVTYNKYIN